MRARWFANDDIPTNILTRLSAKTLHYLKYVSKEWHNLISTSSFIRLQLKTKEPLSGFFFQEIFQWADVDDMESISYIPVEIKTLNVFRTVLNFLPEPIVILSSDNGLLCCRSCLPSSEPKLYICNPLNKQYITLQWPNLSRNCSVGLVFDPFQNLDKSTDFKLVSVSDIEVGDDDFCFVFDIYSSKTGLWRRSNERCQCNHSLIKNKGVSAGGILYWLTDGYQILMFDPQNELSWLVETPLPSTEIMNSVPEMCIGECENKLNYAIICEDGLQLWALEDHFSNMWCLKFFISLEELEKANSDFLYDIKEKVARRHCRDALAWLDPLAFKDWMLFLRVSGNVYLYEFESGRMKKLCDVSTLGPKSMFSPIVVPYAMSLVPLG